MSNHPAIAAEILKPYVRDDLYWLIKSTRTSRAGTTTPTSAPTPRRDEHHRAHPAFELAEQFADEWDQTRFDPDYDTLPLEHFEPALRRVLAAPR